MIGDQERTKLVPVDLINHRRLYEYCGDMPPSEREAAYHAHHQPQTVG